jgi:A/G-specific adenine glycosylase
MLHQAARVVVEELGGSLPASARDLRRLPGMGEYTSAAVASIGFGEAVPAVDANAARVLARVLGLRGDVSRAGRRRALESEARRLLDGERPGEFNQAMMELGALICSPVAPRCASCPVAPFCAAGASLDPAAYPGARARSRSIGFREAIGVVTRGADLLLAQQEHERGWWEGLWTLPRGPLSDGQDAAAVLAETILKRFGIACRFRGDRHERKYGVTRHRVTAVVLRGDCTGGSLKPAGGGEWVALHDAARLGLPAPHRAILDVLLDAEPSVPEDVGEHEGCDD